MKVIEHYKKGKTLHIETPLGIVNIRVGLTDRLGRPVDSIQVIPDSGVKKVGLSNTRLIKLKKKT